MENHHLGKRQNTGECPFFHCGCKRIIASYVYILAQIQAETSVGRGEYSEEVDVFPPAESESRTTVN